MGKKNRKRGKKKNALELPSASGEVSSESPSAKAENPKNEMASGEVSSESPSAKAENPKNETASGEVSSESPSPKAENPKTEMDYIKELVVKYRVSNDPSLGVLVDTNTDILISTLPFLDSEYLKFVLEMSHPNHLSNMLVCQDFAFSLHYETLENYIERLQKENISLNMSFLYPCPDEEDNPFYYNYIPDAFTKILKGLVDFVVYLHKSGKSISKFSSENLFVKDGELKLGKVWFHKATKETIKADYGYIRQVIRNIFDHEASIPGLLKDLYDEMKVIYIDSHAKLNELGFEGYFKNHLSLMSHKRRVAFFRMCDDLYYEVKDTPDQRLYLDALRDTSDSPYWRTNILDNPHTYGSVCSLLDKSLNDPNLIDNSNKSLVRFGRNLVSHLREYKTEYQREEEEVEEMIFVQQIDLLILACFGTWYLDFHKKLHKHGLLEDMMEDI